MTSLVAIRCSDGVVIGADSSATFGDGGTQRTIEQLTGKKIEIVGNSKKMIVAGTGYVGHHQRFVEAVRIANARGDFKGDGLSTARALSRVALTDFTDSLPQGVIPNQVPYSAFVAYSHNGMPHLCEFAGMQGFQPEMKQPDDLWFASAGSGQSITDPFLALLRSIFWKDQCPDTKGGVFMAYWALQHACEVNPGGIKEPIRVAVLAKKGSALDAWVMTDDELAETKDLVSAATDHFGTFKTIMLGQAGAKAPPAAPAAPD